MKYLYSLLLALVVTTGISAQNAQWVTLAIAGGATIDFPDTPKSVQAAGQSVLTLNYGNHVYTALSGKANLGANPDSEAINKVYDAYIQGTMYSVPGIKLVDEKYITVNGVSGKEFLLTGNIKGINIWLTTRALIADNVLYSCLYVTYSEAEQNSPDKDRFFNSFKINGDAGATAEPIAGTPKFDFEKYVPQLEIGAAIIAGVFVFILLAVFVQYLLKKKNPTQPGPPVG